MSEYTYPPKERDRIGQANLLALSYRYRKGSYKARKSRLQPIRMSAKWTPDELGKAARVGAEHFRVYGDPATALSVSQRLFADEGMRNLKRRDKAVSAFVKARDKAEKAKTKTRRRQVIGKATLAQEAGEAPTLAPYKATPKCSGGLATPCEKKAEYVNANYVYVCAYHKLLIDAFTWENRNKRTWRKLTGSPMESYEREQHELV